MTGLTTVDYITCPKLHYLRSEVLDLLKKLCTTFENSILLYNTECIEEFTPGKE